MFVCRLDSDFGVGYTPMEAFENMIKTIREEGIEPADCEFFEHIQVSIRETKTWSIEPEYDE